MTVDLPVQYWLNGFLLSGVDLDNNWWITQKARGWRGTSKPITDRTPRATASGSYRGQSYRGDRIITLDGTTKCLSAAARADAEDMLGQLIPDGSDLVPLLRIGENGLAQQRYVELDDVVDPIPTNERWFTWNLQLAAPDPRKFAPSWTTVQTPLAVPDVGGIVSLTPGIVSTAPGIVSGTAGRALAATAIGAGAVPNQVVLQLIGPLGGPGLVTYVADTLGTSVVRFRGALGPGDTVFINCDSQPAHDVPGAAAEIPGQGALIGTSSARSAVSVAGGWPALAPGVVGSYVMSGSLGAGSLLKVHTRGAWD